MTAVTRNTEYDVVAVGGGAAGGMAETTWLDATAQADLVRGGEVSAKELVEAAIARIEAVNPRLDAVIRTWFEAARPEADGDLPDGPFRSVPILSKDVACTVAGEPTAFGLGPLREMAWPATSYLAEQFGPPASSSLAAPTRPSSPPRRPPSREASPVLVALVIAGALQEHPGAVAVRGDQAPGRASCSRRALRHRQRQHASRSANPSAWRVS
jgi:Amidase